MIDKVIPTALACFCLLGTSTAAAWTKVNGRVQLQTEEISHCETLALDAAAVMVSRQWNLPVDYLDEDEAPNQAREEARLRLLAAAKSYAVRESENEKTEELKAFVNVSRRKCILDYIDSTPPTSIK